MPSYTPASPAASPPWLETVFFFNDTATTEIYTLSLHDALPIFVRLRRSASSHVERNSASRHPCGARSEEHTSELQSRSDLVCRLLLEKKKEQIGARDHVEIGGHLVEQQQLGGRQQPEEELHAAA